MTLLISPTEPPELKAIGQVSSVPENYGVDVLWPSPIGLVGVQRKEVRDLVNSIQDGRLGKELSQMKQLAQSVLLVEGQIHWTANGNATNIQFKSWSRKQYLGILLSVQSLGIWNLFSMNITETIESVLQLKNWLEKHDHSHLMNRPNPTGPWGRPDNRDWAIHLLQSFPGIGYKMAGQIYDHFGMIPLRWTVSEAELMEVQGIGAGRAASLLGVFNGKESPETAEQTNITSTDDEFIDVSGM